VLIYGVEGVETSSRYLSACSFFF